jgi:phosphate acetyltransferase
MLPIMRFSDLMNRARLLGAVQTAIVHPVSEVVLRSTLSARSLGLIEPVLVGPEPRIRSVAEQADLDLSGIPIHNTPHSHASISEAARLAREGRVELLVKGSTTTDELMSVLVEAASGIRTERRMSHVFVMEVATYHKLLLVTDGALNVTPDLAAKRDIVQNAIDLAHALSIDCPKVAILSAQEKVKPFIPSTIDAAALCKMADRDQITGGKLDGPLAFDNAISKDAAAMKGIRSEVAGDADILLAPDLEVGNMLAKQLTYLASARTAGIVMGARLPIVLTSRSEQEEGRVISLALGVLVAHNRRRKP